MDQSVPKEVVIATARLRALHDKARAEMERVRPSLLGRRVARHGITYMVTRVGLSIAGGHLDMDGVRIGKSGQAGTRVFNIGFPTLCEFLPDHVRGE